MNALEIVARKRIEQTRQSLRRRCSLMDCLLVLLGFAGLVSVLVSLCIFFEIEGFSRGFGLRKLSQPRAVRQPIHDWLESVKWRTALYKDLPPASCDIQWIAAASSEIHHVEAEYILVPAICYSDSIQEVHEVLKNMDTDGTIAGLKIVWILPDTFSATLDVDALIGRDKTGVHVVYPHEFRQIVDEDDQELFNSLSESDKLLFSIAAVKRIRK